MTPTRAREFLEITVGDTVPDAEVGLTPADRSALDALLATDPDLRRWRDDLCATARVLERAYRSGVGTSARDTQLTAAVLAAAMPSAARPPIATLPGATRTLRMLPRAAAAAALLALLPLTAWYVARSNPLAGAGATGGARFVDVAAAAGIDRIGHAGPKHNKQWMVETVGHGAAVLDMDGDGDLDLFVPDGNQRAAGDVVASDWRLYRNDTEPGGELRFTDVTAGSGLEIDGWGCGAVAGDLDADGRPDLFVPCWGRNHLFLNRGGGKFEDVTDRAGVAGLPEEWSTAAALGDLDGDGDLDLYVANYADLAEHMRTVGKGRNCVWRSLPIPCGPTPLAPQQDRLYLNAGDGTFTDATDDRLPVQRRYSFQPMIVDVDGDGWLDVFVATDTHRNLLLLNDGTGRFREAAEEAGVATDARGRSQACMGIARGDTDGDGRPDLVVTNFSHEPNVLYRSRSEPGKPAFVDVTSRAGLAVPSQYTLGWGASLFDHDLDGDLDVLVANGHLYPDVSSATPDTTWAQPLSLLDNDGAGTFSDATRDAGADLVHPRVHGGLLIADFDNDGRPDVFVTVLHDRAVLLRNRAPVSGQAVRFVLLGPGARVEAAGARLTATIGARAADAAGERATRQVVRELLLGSSYSCSEDPRISVALQPGEELVGVDVLWPGGARQSFAGITATGTWELVRGRPEPHRRD